MQLNSLGIFGLLLLLQILEFSQFNYAIACSLIFISLNKSHVSRLPRLIHRNPMVELNDQQFKKEFRFAKPDIARLLNCLQWPRFFELPNKMVFTSELCLLMVLYRFHFPSTLTQVEILFGVPSSSCSYIISHGITMLYAKFGNRLNYFDHEMVLRRLQDYQDSINTKSRGAVEKCFGFIDGTVHQVCRPRTKRRFAQIQNSNNIQRALYSGHKRHHGVKFQSIILPDGMIAMMFGPIEGRRHDITLLKLSKLDERMRLLPPDSYVYGDQAYPARPWLLSPYRGQNKTHAMRRWNRAMRTCRISVEHGFKIITTLWAHLKYVPAQRMFQSAIAKQYVVCAALANLHNCIYPNQISQHYGMLPMTLEEYCAMY